MAGRAKTIWRHGERDVFGLLNKTRRRFDKKEYRYLTAYGIQKDAKAHASDIRAKGVYNVRVTHENIVRPGGVYVLWVRKR